MLSRALSTAADGPGIAVLDSIGAAIDHNRVAEADAAGGRIRSPRVPMVIRSPATMNPYTSNARHAPQSSCGPRCPGSTPAAKQRGWAAYSAAVGPPDPPHTPAASGCATRRTRSPTRCARASSVPPEPTSTFALHLIPGAAFTAAFIAAVAPLRNAGIPPIGIFALAAVLVLIPLELGYLLRRGRQRTIRPHNRRLGADVTCRRVHRTGASNLIQATPAPSARQFNNAAEPRRLRLSLRTRWRDSPRPVDRYFGTSPWPHVGLRVAASKQPQRISGRVDQ